MKKFKFSLDTVLAFKRQEQDAVRAEHAAVLLQLRNQEEILEEVQRKYKNYNEEFCQRKTVGLPITEARLYQSGLRVLEDDIRRETEVLEELKKEEERRRAKVVEARKETATLENLREKKLSSYNRAVQKSEEEFVEEFVASSRTRSHSA